jgi:hypothetical protein
VDIHVGATATACSGYLSVSDRTADCTACINQWLTRDASCPNDRNPLTPASLLSLPPDDETTFLTPDDDVAPVQSAKIDELVKYLKVFDARDKSLVFSQFTSFLDRVAARLRVEGVRFCRFDGSMSAKKVGNVSTVCFARANLGYCTATRSYRRLPEASQRSQGLCISGGHAHLTQVRSCGPESDDSLKCVPSERSLPEYHVKLT